MTRYDDHDHNYTHDHHDQHHQHHRQHHHHHHQQITTTNNNGKLADQWLLSAIGILTGRPHLLRSLFLPTQQEEAGRYCVRLFKEANWTNVFVDTRIPCNGSGEVRMNEAEPCCYCACQIPSRIKCMGTVGPWPVLALEFIVIVCARGLAGVRMHETRIQTIGKSVDRLSLLCFGFRFFSVSSPSCSPEYLPQNLLQNM